MRLMTLLLTLGLLWPVGPPPPEILRGWQPPAGPYGPGHRGVDLAAPPGVEVRAPAAGTVSFAGPVGGRGVLTLTFPGTGAPPLRTTFSPVTPLVKAGTRVAAGAPVARVAPGTHCPETCLHWGLLRGKTYLNPLLLIRRAPSRLLPVDGGPGGVLSIRPGSR
ncbi:MULTISPECIES: murein hydrolase activator EnvC family protein [Streptomyces]|uniref:M23 family peptidase n=1 Tax=Streptomyces venezuelae TaxID=54571 RepID=A0A5P2ANB0_STRVZ|nr:M23 family metallopeptidase [Streptomyces venezuelae]QES19565.1 M23 family peptidase [Streptomyces venezuelae]